MKKLLSLSLLLASMSVSAHQTEIRVPVCSGSELNRAINEAISSKKTADTLKITLEKGIYNFLPEEGVSRELYISNHDQKNPKSVGIMLENCANILIDCNDSEWIYEGRMLPLVISGVENIEIRNLVIDFTNPHISQIVIEENDTINGTITYKVEPWVNYEIRNGNFTAIGNGWAHTPVAGIAFEEGTRHLIYRSGDIGVGTRNVTDLGDRRIRANWKDKRLTPGTRVALRTYGRPTPGIVIDRCKDVSLTDVKVHYAEGMGLLAQNTENITLEGFGVCLRGENDPRYFTTQADATHFSSCSGLIKSNGGLYEGMMDDAINVHGTYLKITSVEDSTTVKAAYQHHQTFGFEWGTPGDSVQIISPRTMDIAGTRGAVKSIEMISPKEFLITFDRPMTAAEDFGIENLTRTPEVEFTNNTVRNNRARGALFSTPRRTVCSDNLFDHTSGAAVLLCGDCNGWYETGACHDVTISGNKFINALTSPYQFTNAIISIFPVIPDMENQKGYFHSGIRITDNVFMTFDNPLLYAKSVDGLTFMNNTVIKTTDFKPYHPFKAPITLERVTNAKLQ